MKLKSRSARWVRPSQGRIRPNFLHELTFIYLVIVERMIRKKFA
ncbi:hypothetical protein LEP1GSC193_3861 [Leptospira alstonii serovar Pingchang str. 80-412]|uniref:Uncharacterized protein n=2 Tax=Leptospira alstonii TaxID=28452 RepID=M6CVG2_9LEPT|nr:hypothetical protein LEP1GSC194_2379 [Leptospira alstonii serovar Sichuan str. 79601]EQA80611.1 hypothetical protein LEP1GSC193_3861 [Leptospira alstonii serovar Pingchang str. 80-412]